MLPNVDFCELSRKSVATGNNFLQFANSAIQLVFLVIKLESLNLQVIIIYIKADSILLPLIEKIFMILNTRSSFFFNMHR